MRRLSVVFVSMILFFTALPLYSQNRVQTRNAAFIVPKGLQPRVNFWIDIFTRYGDNHEVIHHRAYPQVVFMVLDFYTAAKKMNKVALEKYKKEEIKKHVAIVEGAARRLAKGERPVSELEKTMARRMAFLGSGSKKYEDLFKNDLIRSQRGIKERYREALERSGLYLSHIEDIFVKEAGLPKELTRLPFVESSFDYSVRSSVGAAGIWQFMPATARSYKMMVK
ncbi:MAG: transglycosylase SLT domain-containing protein [Bdellovibrionota bacterium]